MYNKLQVEFTYNSNHIEVSRLTEEYIKELHRILKSVTFDSKKEWFSVGDYKKLANVVGGIKTTGPKNVSKEIKKLLDNYAKKGK